MRISLAKAASDWPPRSEDWLLWAEANTNMLKRSDTHGSRISTVAGEDGTLVWPRAVAIDPVHGKVYWTEYLGVLYRANLDGTRPEVIVNRMYASAGARRVDAEIVAYQRGGAQFFFGMKQIDF